jgi:hypothetical protein
MKYFSTLGLMLILPLAFKASAQVSFVRDITPVLRNQCAICHVTGEGTAGLKLYPSVAYQNIVSVPSKSGSMLLVSPGNPQASYLLHKVDGTHLDVGGSGRQMPLDKEARGKIRQWIVQGALNN